MVQRLYGRIAGLFLALSCAMTFTLAFAANTNGSLSGVAKSDNTHLYGTLCSKGTFDCKVAPSYTKLATFRDRTAEKLDNHQISIGAAVQAQNEADAIREQLDTAVRQCALVRRACTGDQKAAEATLRKANAALKKLAG